MSDVFLSYAHADKPRVEALANALMAEGFSVSFEREDLAQSRSWVQIIDEEIRTAAVVVVVWSRSSTDSKWVQEEAYLAHKRGTLLPIRLDHAEVPVGFASLHTADFTRWDGTQRDRRFLHLKETIQKRIADRAAEYEAPYGIPLPSSVSPAWPPRMPSPLTVQPPPAPPAAPSPASAVAAQTAAQPSIAPMPESVPAPPAESVPAASTEAALDPPSQVLRAPPAGPLPPAAALESPDVFVAYSRRDTDTCRNVVAALRSDGLEVFYDQYIQGGDQWRDVITWNIKSCSVFIVLLSASSKDSQQVRKEVNLAASNSKHIIPIMIEDVELDGGLEYELSGLNFIPYHQNPIARLKDAVDKAKTLAAFNAFERRRDYVAPVAMQSFVPQARVAQSFASTSGAAVSTVPTQTSWLRGLIAVVGAMVLAVALAFLVDRVSGRSNSELMAASAIGLFFITFPYVIALLMLFNRLLRDR